MANHVRGEVAVTSHGQTYTLVMDTNAMVEFQGHFNPAPLDPENLGKRIALPKLMQRVIEMDLDFVLPFVWAAMRRHHPATTLGDVGPFIDGAGGLTGFAAQLKQIAAAMQPDKEDIATAGATADDGRPTEAPTARKRGIGAPSTDSRAKSA